MKLIQLFETKRPASYLTDEECIDLHLLGNDKNHLKRGVELEALTKAFKHETSKITKPIYRGLSAYDRKHFHNGMKVGSVYSAPYYLSFSEDPQIAESFSKNYNTDKVLKLSSGSGFCFWKWLQADYKWQEQTDKQSYVNNGTDHDLDVAVREAEWIIDQDVKFEVYLIVDNIISIRPV